VLRRHALRTGTARVHDSSGHRVAAESPDVNRKMAGPA
jgi:hypothetical protein